MSQLYPNRPYYLSYDIESFVHVVHHCVLRFHRTDANNLAELIFLVYDDRRVRESDGAYICGGMKLTYIEAPRSPYRTRSNETLDKFLDAMAALCSKHYSAYDFKVLDRLYGIPLPGAPAPPEKPAPEVLPSPPPPLHDHTALLDVFLKYGAGDVMWKAHELWKEPEDLFVMEGVVRTGKRNFFSSTIAERGDRKRARLQTDSGLKNVQE